MGAINTTAYDGQFVWVNLTDTTGTDYIANMVDISVAGKKLTMPTPKPGFKYNRAAFQIGYPYYGVPSTLYNQMVTILKTKIPGIVCTNYCYVPNT